MNVSTKSEYGLRVLIYPVGANERRRSPLARSPRGGESRSSISSRFSRALRKQVS